MGLNIAEGALKGLMPFSRVARADDALTTKAVRPLAERTAASDELRLSSAARMAFQSGPPDPSQFVTIQGTVAQLLPADASGLPHQKFMFQETAPDAHSLLEVDNDIHFGTEVPNLAVGENLTIRGVEYHDPGKDGIHWTHHDQQPGDAGFIQTPDGHLYQ